MKCLRLFIFAAMLTTTALAADPAIANLDGTWSGDWMIKGGVPDAVTVRLEVDDHGKMTAEFLSPAKMDCTTVTYVGKTRMVTLEASDAKSGAQYKLVGKLSGNEINGTFDSGDRGGQIRLVKWTYFPRPLGS